MNAPKKMVVVIAGPTASGKSSCALDVARAYGGKAVIINADSMQIYKGLPILTACPSAEERAEVSHALYEVMGPDEACSVGMWCTLALEQIKAAHNQGLLPIIVGGTGMYIKALIEGMPAIPNIPLHFREEAQAQLDSWGHERFYAHFVERDPVFAATIRPSDSQRMVRAIEVLNATGKSLGYWQKQPNVAPPDDLVFTYVQIMPDRAWLYERCNRRFDMMFLHGALDEVKNFEAAYPDTGAQVKKSLGYSELSAFLKGAITQEEALESAKQQTRNYAKRQMTWLRGQMPLLKALHNVHGWHEINENQLSQLCAIIGKLRQILLL